MSVLTIGSRGRVARLLQGAWAITGETRVRWTCRDKDPHAEAAVCDPVADPEALAAQIPQGGIVFALAGVTPVTGADLAGNSEIAMSVLYAARQADAGHVFFTSSASVYGNQAGMLDEVVPVQPQAPYGQSKADMEQAVLERAETPYTILRMGNLAGADQLLGVPGDKVLDRFPDGTHPRRSYIGPVTLARVLSDLFDLAQRGATLPQVLNIACHPPSDMADLLRAADVDWQDRAAPPQAIPNVALDCSRLWRLLDADGHCDAVKIVEELNQVRARAC